ncbi:hypothetical protein FDECE_13034 [Fusarium decemcellulare]|nr:hypothetical protein FDECE_13034 [Fusarium decemcellulare]
MPSRDTGIVPIPEPRGLPYLGHVNEFRSEDSLQDLDRLHDTYGDIFRLRFPGVGSCVFVGTHKLVNEICDEKRFKKSIQAEIAEARLAAGDGLFTARDDEVNWGIAHRILMPAFGPVSIRAMFDEMYDTASQMTLKWARLGSSHPIPASEDFTRLALDTLGLCSMGYRFNSFYKDDLHPFVQSMADSLVELGNRTQRPKWASIFYRSSERKLHKDINVMRNTSHELIKARKADPDGSTRRDLLTAMIEGVDPRTGAKLSDESIINNLVTFLVAGHETTSGTLSFAFYSMLKNPHTFQAAQKEVDDIMGQDRITVDKLFKLRYIPAVLRETLRQCSPIPGITLEAYEDTLLDGKYCVKKGEPIAAVFSRSHLDPAVYGEDAGKFKPERMLDENFDRLQKDFPNCWKPFGNGMRACIGRPFAWQEMLLATSLLLQNFDFCLHDPAYTLKIAETLTIKPKEFFMRAYLRHGMSPLDLERRLRGESLASGVAAHPKVSADVADTDTKTKPISIYYGSNSGTCEALVRRLASNASTHGFRPVVVDSLDVAKNCLPRDHPVVIFVSSYEGQPPDNAKHFIAWLEVLVGQKADGVAYAVFGAGNSEWRQTFHRIPKLVDSELEKHGAERLAPIGLTDVAEKDPFLDFESWEDTILWPALETKYSISKLDGDAYQMGLAVDISTPRPSTLRQNVKEAIVTAVRDLTASDMPRKRHIQIRLPTGLSYEAGDYLAVLPQNPRETVSRVFRRFKLPWDAMLVIKGDDTTLLPMTGPTSAVDVLSSYVELTLPATKKNLLVLATHAHTDETRSELKTLAAEDRFEAEITNKRLSVIDLLELYPSIELPLSTFLGMLAPMRIRQYSISSSPLHDPHHVDLTYSVLEEPSISGHGKHIGVASNYLAGLQPDERLHVSVRPSHAAFHLPRTPETTPIICIAAGSGLAPFRGFIQQRAVQIKAQRALAPALLIFGCRSKGDDIYHAEFDAWEAEGAVTVKRAYSRQKEETSGCRYVQDRMLEQKQTLFDLWEKDAKLFVCGSRQVSNAVEATCVELMSELKRIDKESAQRFLDEIRNERVATDVFD